MDLDLRLPQWDALAPAEQDRLAGQVAAKIGGRVLELSEHADGDQRHRVAQLEVRGVPMVLVPGGRALLGWTRGKTALEPDRLAAWEAENDTDQSFEDTLDDFFTPARTVDIAPFLLERAPRPIDVDTLDDADDLHAAVLAQASTDGFRVVTDDEWEHAARGGSTTLFRWGDRWPDGVPWSKQTTFTGHKAPNAFGLTLLDDPYRCEVVAERLGFRGGDGGSAVCGGRPEPEAWYSFASAFRWPMELAEDALFETLENGFVRRALSV